MFLVDTGVWIDFLREKTTQEVDAVNSLLEREETIAFTGIILQELMQGCSGEKDAVAIEKHFLPFIEIFPQRGTYKLAARIYRNCRNRGFTIRSSVDCLIAACAMEQNCSVLHRDRDFSIIAEICSLKVYNE
ncbi:MAG: PIN domain nuclease [Verrucomicrobia bacterium]|nr:PIN domain nuclease [Verrucomicrobiota bacterium]